MKKKSNIRLITILIIMAAGLLISCPPPGSSGNKVTLRIDLYLSIPGPVAGEDFTIQVRDSAGSVPAIWSDTVDATTLIHSTWNSFSVSDISLTKGQTYRIYATYSGGVGQVSWSCSSAAGPDQYLSGVCSTPNALQDFTFKTYNSGVLDQQMITLNTGYSLSGDNFQWWQEFVPGD